ncbi:MAG: hypothetical protein J0M17_09115 [Planctomycetes bacterium]|jgi:hypothetical protein|nr:hypothetical protein [Planctomycetota bacterium]
MNSIKIVMPIPLGEVVITPGAVVKLDSKVVSRSLVRHMAGDWGEVNEEDWELNDAALEGGDRLVSRYRGRDEKDFFIITEADRSITTILLPEEY